MIDVGLAWDLDSLTLTPGTRAALALRRGRPGQVDPETELRSPLAVRRRAAGAVATWGAQGTLDLERGDTLWVGDERRARRAALRLERPGTGAGASRCSSNPRGALTLATRLPLEPYLLGVVPGEIGALREIAARGRARAGDRRAQLLALLPGPARDRGLRPVRHRGGPGLRRRRVPSVRSPRAASTTTRALVALADGQPIRANYCSTCGGITAEVWEAWPAGALPYLREPRGRRGRRLLRASPQYRWREEWEASEFLRTLARWAPTQRLALPGGGSGRAASTCAWTRARARDACGGCGSSTTTGEVVVPAYALRQVLRRPGTASAILRSNLFKIDVRRDAATRRARAVIASGAGFGHGVGLCQTGALGMAQGRPRRGAILEHYYRGVALKSLY